MGPDLRQLRYFLALEEERSFTRAAQRLHLTQITRGGFQFSGPRNGVAAIWHRYGGPKLHENPRVTSALRARHSYWS